MTTNTKPFLCAIYKSSKKDEMYLYIEKRDQFDVVPEALRQMFGKPQFVMMFNLTGNKPLKRSKNEEVLQMIQAQYFYLQMPPPPENLLKTFLANNKGEN